VVVGKNPYAIEKWGFLPAHQVLDREVRANCRANGRVGNLAGFKLYLCIPDKGMNGGFLSSFVPLCNNATASV
jgi:hypothetical protein